MLLELGVGVVGGVGYCWFFMQSFFLASSCSCNRQAKRSDAGGGMGVWTSPMGGPGGGGGEIGSAIDVVVVMHS